MATPEERPPHGPQIVCIVVLALVLCTLLVYRFTSRSAADADRARARIVLQTIYALEKAHLEETGTYLPVDRGSDSEILKLSDAPGPFRYRVAVLGTTFVAVAEADLDGDGELEVWQVDQAHPEPTLKEED
ncbi:MAG: hypothetical protein QGI83_18255 [Candidatus Latescibacteria bacterium]|jgi:hypothetical protein|nr:hypothetical protein [Candidatus Latescibacterota bacterium]